VVGRIFKMPVAPQDSLWMWASGHSAERAAHGYEPTREAAMAAFKKSWRRGMRERHASGLPCNAAGTVFNARARPRTLRQAFAQDATRRSPPPATVAPVAGHATTMPAPESIPASMPNSPLRLTDDQLAAVLHAFPRD
jgi:hypothetical protein